VLVVEVSESSLRLDRDYKGSLYARARLEDYWIVNPVDRVLEIYREPAADPSTPHGWRYAATLVLAPDASASMLALPDVSLAFWSLLP
jgi:Uma2 family endonuclease